VTQFQAPLVGKYCFELVGFFSHNLSEQLVFENVKIHCKKRLAVFLSPAGMSLTKLSLAGKYYIIPGQGEFGK
jgi:hypothetical protein